MGSSSVPSRVSRRSFIKGVVVAAGAGSAGLLLAACGAAPSQPPTAKDAAKAATSAPAAAAKRTAITLQLNFTPLGRFAPFYYGVESGMYGKRNLDVSIATSSGSGPALQQLIAGNAQWMTNDLSQMMSALGKSPQPHMRSYAVFFAKASQTIFFFKDGPIKTPKDLEGKTIATSAGSNEYLLFPIFAKANGIDESKIEWKVVDATAKTGLLLQGATDATSTTIFGLPGLEMGAKPGQQIGYFMFGDHGVNSYGASLVTTDDYAKAHPEGVAPFVKASMEAIDETFKNPRAAVDAMAKHVANLDKDVALAELKLLPNIVIGPIQKEKGTGYQDPEMVKATYDQVVNVLNQPLSLQPSEFFTNDALG